MKYYSNENNQGNGSNNPTPQTPPPSTQQNTPKPPLPRKEKLGGSPKPPLKK